MSCEYIPDPTLRGPQVLLAHLVMGTKAEWGLGSGRRHWESLKENIMSLSRGVGQGFVEGVDCFPLAAHLTHTEQFSTRPMYHQGRK